MAFQRKGGAWYSDFTGPDLERGGRRRYRLSLGTVSGQREAEVAERRMQAGLEQEAARREQPAQPQAPGRPVSEPSALPDAAFSGFARFWLDTYAKIHMRPASALRHEKTIRVWLIPFFHDRLLRTITRLDIQRFVAHSAGSVSRHTKRTLSPKTVNDHLSCLSTMLNQAVAWGYLRENPCEGTGRMEAEPERWDFYTAEETEAWLQACRESEPRWYPFFLTGFRTGLRIGEMFALEWGDLDFRSMKLHVRRAVSAGQITLPKNKKRRVVDMSPHLAGTLQQHRHLHGPLVFCTGEGGRLSRDMIRHPWVRITRLAGLRQLRHHDMRHSFASQLVMKSVPILAVQQLLGHASLEMTMRYAHLAPGANQQFVALLDGGGEAGGKKTAEDS